MTKERLQKAFDQYQTLEGDFSNYVQSLIDGDVEGLNLQYNIKLMKEALDNIYASIYMTKVVIK